MCQHRRERNAPTGHTISTETQTKQAKPRSCSLYRRRLSGLDFRLLAVPQSSSAERSRCHHLASTARTRLTKTACELCPGAPSSSARFLRTQTPNSVAWLRGRYFRRRTHTHTPHTPKTEGHAQAPTDGRPPSTSASGQPTPTAPSATARSAHSLLRHIIHHHPPSPPRWTQSRVTPRKVRCY